MTTEIAKTDAQWADEINAAYGRVVGSYLELGHILIAAKAALDQHGRWERMVAAYLPFDISTAQRLMKIARDPRIAKAAHGQLLPDSWRTTYELTRLPDEAFARAEANGEIHRRMSRKDAITLVRLALPPPREREKSATDEEAAPGDKDKAAEAEAAHRWRNSVAVHAKNAIDLTAMWAKTYGPWKRFEVTQDLRDTARKAADAWDGILKAINAKLEKQQEAEANPPKTGAERTRAWRQRQRAAKEETTDEITSAADVTTLQFVELPAKSLNPVYKDAEA
jgi:hypothetical protein